MNKAKVAIGTFIIGMLTHSFFLNNVLKNYDATIINGYGAGVTSGRWLLDWAGGHFSEVWGDYNLPYFMGMLSILVLACTVVVICDLLNIQDWKYGICIGAIIMCFPSVTTTLLFTYTTLFDMIAILLAVLAAWLTEKKKYGFLLGMLCMACSLGIYQAYLPILVTLLLLLGIQYVYGGEKDIRGVLFIAGKYLGTIVGSLVLYYAILKWRLWHTGNVLSGYRGIDKMGHFDGGLGETLVSAYRDFFSVEYYRNTGIAKTCVSIIAMYVSIVLIVVLAICIISSFIKKSRTVDQCNTRIVMIFILAVALALIPLAVNTIEVMCSQTDVSTLMAFTMVFVYIIPVVLLYWKQDLNGRIKKVLSGVEAGIIIIVSLNYGYQANGCYANMYYSNEQAQNYLNSVMAQVRMTEGFTADKEWVVIGKTFKDPMYENPWNVPQFQYGGSELAMMNGYFRDMYVQQYLGMQINRASYEDTVAVKNMEEVKKMPCYPDYGSIKVVDDYVVIKIEEE